MCITHSENVMLHNPWLLYMYFSYLLYLWCQIVIASLLIVFIYVCARSYLPWQKALYYVYMSIKYIVLYCITKFRTAMTKLRVSYYRLEVETGRWSRPVSKPFDERKCHICNKLEDEFHFRFECPLYTDLRRQYLSRYYIVRPSMYKLIKPLKKLMLKSVLEIYQYIFKAFQLRQNTIYIEMWLNYFLFWISM